MNRPDQDKGKSATNLQKLYSSQVQENYSLQRQKSDIDYEKAKKFRELNFNESSFLRKYEKYVVPDRRRRRSSIDANLARAIECKYSARSRPQSQIADRSLARDAVSSECPYSLETWSKLVDVDQSVIDANKRDILFGEEKCVDDNNNKNDSDGETSAILDEMARTNISLLEQGKRLRRRQTLKPLETTKATFGDNPIDEEILEIQLKQKKRGRRHSIALGALHTGEFSKDTLLKLPKIKESCVQSGISSNLQQSKVHSSDDNIAVKKLTTSGRKLSLSDGGINVNILSSVNGDRVNKRENKGDGNVNTRRENFALVDNDMGFNKSVPEIRIDKVSDTHDGKENRSFTHRNTPRPVANAAVFVQGDSDNSPNSMFDSKEAPEKLPLIEPKEVQQPSFLPRIELTKAESDVISERDEEEIQLSSNEINGTTDRSESTISRLTSENGSKPVTKSGRRGSMATTALKLLVDSHHGAAKLRYIAKLAHEMEKEEIAKHPREPEPDIFQELNNCRYLRVRGRKGSEEDEGEIY